MDFNGVVFIVGSEFLVVVSVVFCIRVIVDICNDGI